MTGATTELGTCRVRSEPDHPCHRLAVVELWGVLFCEQCAREQEAYFAIGELTQGPATDRETQAWYLRDEPLVEVLDQMRREFTGRIAEAGRLQTAKQEARHPGKSQGFFMPGRDLLESRFLEGEQARGRRPGGRNGPKYVGWLRLMRLDTALLKRK